MMQWVLAATLICGASVFTSCSSDTIDNPAQEQSKKNRKEFIEHTRSNLRDLAENLNFGSWEAANELNMAFNQYVLNNPEFSKAVLLTFMQKMVESIVPVEEGSELAEKGYKVYATMDFTEFNYRFSMNDENTGFDVEEADNFEVILNGWNPATQQVEKGNYKVTLKAGGSSFLVFMKGFSDEELAVVGKMPTEFEFAIATKYSGIWEEGFTGSFKNDVSLNGTSQYIESVTDAFNISGTITSTIPARGGEKGDAATVKFAIGQDAITHEAGVQLAFIHNGRNILSMRTVMENLNGETDYSQFTSSMSLVDALINVMAGNNLKEGSLTLLDDLTTTVTISDCQKAIQVRQAMNSARRNYADQQTIDQYTQQLNQIITGSMTCKGLNQTIPMKMKTIKFGVDYTAVPALNFADENGYVALTDMLDKESIEYMFNIVDHAADPMQESLVVVRQLYQYIKGIASGFQGEE